ncbi:MAG TPA: thioesterase family protein [Methylomirabilota bacterium]|nr:thioesterase family protein [Methylomirabilota bacterium]
MVTETKVRVRYAETDAMGVVYYSNYLVYMEVGRVEYLRQHGYAMSEVNQKVLLPVVEASCRYLKAAALDDLLSVRTRITERKRMSFTFGYEIVNAGTGELVASGHTRHGCWDPASKTVVPIPEWLQAILSVDGSLH